MSKILRTAGFCGALCAAVAVQAVAPKQKEEKKGAASPNAACSIVVKGTDGMQYHDASDKKLEKITIPKACSTFKVDLEHSGKLDMKVMGHNFIVSKEADLDGVVKVAMSKFMTGVADDKKYIPPVGSYDIDGKKVEVLVSSEKLLGSGQKETIIIDGKKLKKGEKYKFFCTFPGHSSMMRGDLALE